MMNKDELTTEIQRLTPQIRFVSLDLINQLPDTYSYIADKLYFDSAKDFLECGFGDKTVYAPSANFLDKVAEKCGICMPLENAKHIETITDMIDINPLIMKSIEEDATIRRRNIAVRVSTTVMRLMEDGTYVYTTEIKEVNYWQEAVRIWSEEELHTKFYTENMTANKSAYYKKKKNGDSYTVPIKYDDRYKRNHHLRNLEQYALEKASTGSRARAIHALSGFPKNFKKEHLSLGYFILGKIVKSKESLKAEHAARITSISRGDTKSDDPVSLLTQEEPTIQLYEEVENYSPIIDQAIKKVSTYIEKGIEKYFPPEKYEKIKRFSEIANTLTDDQIKGTLVYIEKNIPTELKENEIPL